LLISFQYPYNEIPLISRYDNTWLIADSNKKWGMEALSRTKAAYLTACL